MKVSFAELRLEEDHIRSRRVHAGVEGDGDALVGAHGPRGLGGQDLRPVLRNEEAVGIVVSASDRSCEVDEEAFDVVELELAALRA